MREALLVAAVVAPLYWGATHTVGFVFGAATAVAVVIAILSAWTLVPLLFQ